MKIDQKEEIHLKQSEEVLKEEPEKNDDILLPSDVPKKSLYGHDLKKLKSFKKIRQSAKLINKRNQFIHDLESILKFLPASDIDNDLDDEILIEVMELAESHFFYGDKETRDYEKQASVLQVMLPYFRNDVKILQKTMNNVFHRVKKLSRRSRTWKKFKVFFCQSVKLLAA